MIKKEHVREYIGFTLNSNLTGNHTITGEIQIYEVWWIGVIVPSKLEFKVELNCKEKECRATLR
ncbi:hypothetical protein ADU37_CDS14500 [Thermococcus sp. 2319x1]|uniref:hypothetical protein n=1 Tax=Thermococcus sp. 2319x1 TaxID=1674923 RepID=UPI00073AB41A|nr:hypothetical protein [Thermococcus sp. 2319x1]ALV63149.1 hypothetical protein ADU37_CDS14500 [Thermococcus sp. 2319x1]